MEITVRLTTDQVKILLLVVERGMTIHPADADIIARRLRKSLPDFDPCDESLVATPFTRGRK